VHEHHDAEEKIFFPWIKTRTTYPERQFSQCHDDLISTMLHMKKACETICEKGGKNCVSEISLLKNMIPNFVSDMRSHLHEEEESIPALMRDNFTEDEEKKIVDKILKAGGLALTKTFLPAILLSMQLWMTSDSYDDFCNSLPLPIKHLTFKVRPQTAFYRVSICSSSYPAHSLSV
jgi:hemerythrin superfamily protein